jgi:hypothetical protein
MGNGRIWAGVVGAGLVCSGLSCAVVSGVPDGLGSVLVSVLGVMASVLAGAVVV